MDFRSTTTLTMKYRIMNPTLYTNMIRVHPAVDRGIINWAKGTDGVYRPYTELEDLSSDCSGWRYNEKRGGTYVGVQA